ncbi:hypothetical protein [Cochlodiniinecator piscidefendens]|uniref:hypothetical protein n=1 Tax=Cochlodiniinecator piscidefendens TaxID=2715756 RepID=UPI0014094973|nr:hypothetical protein [Cochlodiniinecator piscidefendens]
MNAITEFERAEAVACPKATPFLEQTFGGYAVKDKSEVNSKWLEDQVLKRAAGYALMVLAIGLWLMPGAIIAEEVIGIKLAFSLLIILLGHSFIRASEPQDAYELHVDLKRSELRGVLRDAKGEPHLVSHAKFKDIVSIWVDMQHDPREEARLMMQRREGCLNLELMRGSAQKMNSLREMLLEDLRL